MEHWLDEKFEEIKRTEGKGSDEENIKNQRIKANFEKNENDITAFINKLKTLFNKLTIIGEEGFEYYHDCRSLENKPECDEFCFSGENSTQHPTFLRRFCISVSDEDNMMIIKLYRGKRSDNEKPWKYHDEQNFLCDVSKLNEERAYELIDWFAWKIYTPRGLR